MNHEEVSLSNMNNNGDTMTSDESTHKHLLHVGVGFILYNIWYRLKFVNEENILTDIFLILIQIIDYAKIINLYRHIEYLIQYSLNEEYKFLNIIFLKPKVLI